MRYFKLVKQNIIALLENAGFHFGLSIFERFACFPKVWVMVECASSNDGAECSESQFEVHSICTGMRST